MRLLKVRAARLLVNEIHGSGRFANEFEDHCLLRTFRLAQSSPESVPVFQFAVDWVPNVVTSVRPKDWAIEIRR